MLHRPVTRLGVRPRLAILPRPGEVLNAHPKNRGSRGVPSARIRAERLLGTPALDADGQPGTYVCPAAPETPVEHPSAERAQPADKPPPSHPPVARQPIERVRGFPVIDVCNALADLGSTRRQKPPRAFLTPGSPRGATWVSPRSPGGRAACRGPEGSEAAPGRVPEERLGELPLPPQTGHPPGDLHQEPFVMPGSSPLCAICRNFTRDRPNFRR